MNSAHPTPLLRPNRLIAAAFALATAGHALAQTTGGDASAAGMADRPSPYYIGASEGIYYDSNVYRVPFGQSDVYSQTSLFGGFDQPIGRQRVFGLATVSYSRYQDESTLNNTSYSLLAGLDWSTVGRLSGNLTATLDQRLSAPVAGTDSTPEVRNQQRTQGFSGLARWGGESLLTLEGRYSHVHVDYSEPQYDFGEQTSDTFSIAGYYRPSSLWRVGAGVTFGNVRSPQSVVFADGSSGGNSARSRSIDLLADYDNGSALTAHGRLSFTHQSNSEIGGADFSGITGDLNAAYRATGKIVITAGASRYTGLNTASYAFPVTTTTSTGTTTTTGGNTIANSYLNTYQNTEVTNALYGSISYAATSKITGALSGRYSRAQLALSGLSGGSDLSATDTSRGATLSVNYAYSRAWNFNCSVSKDYREVSGDRGFGYGYETAGCVAAFTWR